MAEQQQQQGVEMQVAHVLSDLMSLREGVCVSLISFDSHSHFHTQYCLLISLYWRFSTSPLLCGAGVGSRSCTVLCFTGSVYIQCTSARPALSSPFPSLPFPTPIHHRQTTLHPPPLTHPRKQDPKAALALVSVRASPSHPPSKTSTSTATSTAQEDQDQDQDPDLRRATDLVSLHYAVRERCRTGDLGRELADARARVEKAMSEY